MIARSLVVTVAVAVSACAPRDGAEDVGEGEGEGEGEDTPAGRALAIVNALRRSAGIDDARSVPEIVQAAQAHADYYAVNPAAGLNAHDEQPGPSEFTGTTFVQRLSAAGYTGQPFFEVMAFRADEALAIADWRDSVLHRVPLLHPNAPDLGYGVALGGDGTAVDVMDFGYGASDAAVAIFPPDGATNVPRAWAGNELPQPPAPPGGFPSGPVISVSFDDGASASITAHSIRDGDGDLVPHQFVSPSTPDVGPFMLGTFALYPDEPLAPGAALEVRVSGTAHGSVFERTWTFTTE